MENQFWEVLAAHPFFVVVVIIGGLFALAAILIATDNIHKRLGFKTKSELERDEWIKKEQIRDKQRQDIWDQVKSMRDEFRQGFERNDAQYQQLEKQMQDMKKANIMMLGDRITQKTKYYLNNGYIPAEQMTEYRALYDSYKKIGGNHGVDDLIEKTIETLPLKSPK